MTGFVSHVASQHLHEVMCGGPEGAERGADERGEVAVLDGGNTLGITALLAPLEVPKDGREVLQLVRGFMAIEDGNVDEAWAQWVEEAFDPDIRPGTRIGVGGRVLKAVTGLCGMEARFTNRVCDDADPAYEELSDVIVASHNPTPKLAALGMVRGEGGVAAASTVDGEVEDRELVPQCQGVPKGVSREEPTHFGQRDGSQPEGCSLGRGRVTVLKRNGKILDVGSE